MRTLILTSILVSLLISISVCGLFRSASPSISYEGTTDPAIEIPLTPDKSDYATMTLGADPADTQKDTNYILYRYGRMDRLEKGLWLAPDVPLPPCDDTVRGLLWFNKEDKGDALLICRKDTNGSTQWTSL
jgi:hypothetical protein